MQMGPVHALVDFAEVERLAEAPVYADASASNQASIAALFEFAGSRILVPGDLPDDELIEAIEALLSETGEQRLRLDAMVVPHHGSRHSMSRRLLALIDCRRFLVSTDGSRFEHPDAEAIARIVTSESRSTELIFNYRTYQTETWADGELQQRFGYTATYPSDPDGGIVVDVFARPETVGPPALVIVQDGPEVSVEMSDGRRSLASDAGHGADTIGHEIVQALERWSAPTTDPEVALEEALVDLAQAGSRLAHHIGDLPTRPEPTTGSIPVGPRPNPVPIEGAVQLLTRATAPYLPIEFIYDRQLGSAATLCPTWRTAAETGVCVGCDDPDAVGRYVCPSGFWSLRRPIARLTAVNTLDVPRSLLRPPLGVRIRPTRRALLLVGRDAHDLEAATATLAKANVETVIASSWKQMVDLLDRERWSILGGVTHVRDSTHPKTFQIGDEAVPIDRLATWSRSDDTGADTAVFLGSFATPAAAASLATRLLDVGCVACITNIGPATVDHARRAFQTVLDELTTLPPDPSISTAPDPSIAILRARRRLILDANPLGLSLITFG